MKLNLNNVRIFFILLRLPLWSSLQEELKKIEITELLKIFKILNSDQKSMC